MSFSRRTFIQLGSVPLLGACVDLSKTPIVGRARARQMGVRIGYLPTGASIWRKRCYSWDVGWSV